jgi:hypothetical protein
VQGPHPDRDPTEGFLDDAASQGGLSGHSFVTVGNLPNHRTTFKRAVNNYVRNARPPHKLVTTSRRSAPKSN